jgi:transposase-like protein
MWESKPMKSKHSGGHYYPSKSRRPIKTRHTPACPNCKSNRHIVLYGKRRTKAGPAQIYRCINCSRNFTSRPLKYAQYPDRIILNAVSTYNLGYTQKETLSRINKRFKTKISQPTLSTWLKRYSDLCTFNRLRKKYVIDPKEIIVSKKFHHQQVYEFKYHKLKLNIAGKKYPGIKTYIQEVLASLDNSLFETGPRCSAPSEDIKQSLLKNILPKIEVKRFKNNNAVKIASLSRELARTNRERHNKIQNFFLINDSATVAIEVPVYLRPKEARAFKIPLTAPLTGHIDILQMRRGQVHVLDYKPDMINDKTTQMQLLLYAFLLGKRANIQLTSINCAYFDDQNYYHFKPMAVKVLNSREHGAEPKNIPKA